MIGVETNLPLQSGFAIFGILCLVIILILVIDTVIAYWMYKDAEKRNENGALWAVLGWFASILGLIIWLLVRPDMSEVRREEQMRRWQQQLQRKPPPPPPQDMKQKQCPDCGAQLRYIYEYDRSFCDSCREYK